MSIAVKIEASETQQQKEPLPPSPCIGICALDEVHGICGGCGRTPEDIAIWPEASQNRKALIWRALPERLARLGVHVVRLPATPEEIGAFLEQSLASKAGTWEIGVPGMALRFEAATAGEVLCEPSCVTAKNANGDVIQLIKHDRARAFGVTDEGCPDRLTAVVMVLPSGRAQIAQSADAAAAASQAGAQILDLSCPYVRCSLRVPAQGTSRLHAETMLATIDAAVSAHEIATFKSYRFDETRLGAFSIPRAFAVCAVFRARDRDWLTRLMAP